MPMLMKPEHIVIKSGRKTFRRRIPQDLLMAVSKTFCPEVVHEFDIAARAGHCYGAARDLRRGMS